jgi:hypothetical protein
MPLGRLHLDRFIQCGDEQCDRGGGFLLCGGDGVRSQKLLVHYVSLCLNSDDCELENSFNAERHSFGPAPPNSSGR